MAHGQDYLSYFTTTAEYDAQHYEGSSTLYGPSISGFLIAQVRDLAEGVEGQERPSPAPGIRSSRLIRWRPCDATRWRPVGHPPEPGSDSHIEFRWRGLAKGHACPSLPTVSVECRKGESWRMIDHDDGLRFHVLRESRRIWLAKWRPALPLDGTSCRFRVERAPEYGGELVSPPFDTSSARPR